MPLHWWLRPAAEQKRIRRWATKELKERQAEEVQRRLGVARLEERQRAAELATRCPFCRGTGRAVLRAGVDGGMPSFRTAPCPCTAAPAEGAPTP